VRAAKQAEAKAVKEAADAEAAKVLAEERAQSAEAACALSVALAASAATALKQMEAKLAESKGEAAAAKAEATAAQQARLAKDAAYPTRLELPVLEIDFAEADADKSELTSPSHGVNNAAPAAAAIEELESERKKLRSIQSERKIEIENYDKKKELLVEKFSALTISAKRAQADFEHFRGELDKKRTEHCTLQRLMNKCIQLYDEDSRKGLALDMDIANAIKTSSNLAHAKKQEALKLAQDTLDAAQAEGKLLVATQDQLAEIRRQYIEEEVLPTAMQAFAAARGCLSAEVQSRLGNLLQTSTMKEIKRMAGALGEEKARVEKMATKAQNAIERVDSGAADLQTIIEEFKKVLPMLFVAGIEQHQAQTVFSP